jgi:CHAD domain-containing protein
MKSSDEFLSALDKSWNALAKSWKKSRTTASEKSVHDLRVNTRRLAAALELAGAVITQADVRKLQRRLKKLLKSMGPLRDVQVQLDSVSAMRGINVINRFRRRLKRREKQEITRIQARLKRDRKEQLSEAFEDVRAKFSRRMGRRDDRLRRSVERFLSTRRREYLSAKQRFQRVRPINEDALHEMRIALKKFRYAVEAAKPVLGRKIKEQTRAMHAFQQLIGDSRDLEILRGELEKWAKKKGKKIAVVPLLESLQNDREVLLKKIIESCERDKEPFENVPQPVVETTAIAPRGETTPLIH